MSRRVVTKRRTSKPRASGYTTTSRTSISSGLCLPSAPGASLVPAGLQACSCHVSFEPGEKFCRKCGRKNAGAVFQIGEIVECRDSGESFWMEGFVTSLDPLEVTLGHQVEKGPFEWDEVRSVKAILCCTKGCSRLPWNGVPGHACCRTCTAQGGHKHGPDCDRKWKEANICACGNAIPQNVFFCCVCGAASTTTPSNPKKGKEKLKHALESQDVNSLEDVLQQADSLQLNIEEIEELKKALAKELCKQEARHAISEAASNPDAYGLWDPAIELLASAGVPENEIRQARMAAKKEVQHLKELHASVKDDGIVVFVAPLRKLTSLASQAIEEISSERRILQCVSVAAAHAAMETIRDDSLVCFVCDETCGLELAEHIRYATSVNPLLRSMPIVLFDGDKSLRADFVELGLVQEVDKNKLGMRILSLPSLVAIRSETSAGTFKGSMTSIRFGHFEKEPCDVMFTENEEVLLSSIARHRLPWYRDVEEYDEHIARLECYFDALQPVHRCKPGVLLAILREGGLMSRDDLETLLGSSRAAVMRTARHVRLIQLARDPRFRKTSRQVFKYAEAVCELELCGRDGRTAAEQKVEKERPQGLPRVDSTLLDEVVNAVVKDVVAQKDATIGGIGYEKDRILGTTRHVFSTLGPNYGFHYGSVVLILSRDLLYHPGTWCTPLAATGFVGPNFWVFRHRPWGSAALLDKALHGVKSYDISADELPEMPEADAEGVEACFKSALNMAAMKNWPRIMSREVDAMCHYLCFGNREPYTFDEPFDGAKCKQFRKRLVDDDDKMKPDAWKAVVEYYETKDSHTLYECHLPGFVPIGAIEKVIISSQLYDQHSEIKEKVDTFIMPDGRKLSDLVVVTETSEECVKWQHDYFLQQRLKAAGCPGGRLPSSPASVYLAGRSGRPAYLSPDFANWYSIGQSSSQSVLSKPGTLCIAFATRATHDIRVMFSRNADAQNADYDLSKQKLQDTTYHFCLGMNFNQVSFITRGIRGTRHIVHFEGSDSARAVCCGTGTEAQMVWERYWFRVNMVDKSALLQCGRGPVGENVLMEWTDPKPIKGLQYVGLSCWNQPTIYCDLRVA